MLKRFFSRRSFVLSAQILSGVATAVMSINHTFAQFSSPATFGVYNRAASMGSGGMNGAALPQGINAFNAQNSGTGFASETFFSGAQSTSENWDTIVVDSPEFIYKGHDPKHPILSVETVMFDDGTDYRYGILTGSGDTTAKFWVLEGKYDQETTEWSVTSARVRATFKDEHRQGVTKATFSPDYRFVLTSSYDQTGRLWTFNKQENIRAYLGEKDRLWSIAASPSGQYVAGACNDGRIYFWEAMTVKKLGTLPNRSDSQTVGSEMDDIGHSGPVFDVAFDPNSEFVATAGADSSVRLWNLGLMKQVSVLKGHQDKVYSVRFSEDGSMLLTASRDKTARLWNPATGEEICRFVGHDGAVRDAIFAGNYICTSSDDGTVRIWSSNFRPENQRQEQNLMLGSTSFSPSATSPTMPNSTDRQQVSGKPTRKLGRAKGVELARFEANSPVFSVDTTEDLVYIVGGCQDGQVRVWRVPGNARYFEATDSNYRNGSYGLGNDPLANFENLSSDLPKSR